MEKTNNRILIVDDESSFMEIISEALCPDTPIKKNKAELDLLASALFGKVETEGNNQGHYDLTFCSQGEEGVEEIKKSMSENHPFAMVFLDIKMPPGKDGVWTARNIRKYDQMINILIMTAYSDVDPGEFSASISPADKLLYVQKPLRPQEIRQFASALCAKWQSENDLFTRNLELLASRRELAETLAARTHALNNTNKALHRTKDDLLKTNMELSEKDTELQEHTVAMKVLMKNIVTDQKENEYQTKDLDKRILLNIKELTEPFLDKLATTDLDKDQLDLLDILRNNLEKATSSAMHRLYSSDAGFTPSEIQIANLIKQGKTTKYIADVLRLSVRTIEFHRDNIRKKLGINDRKISLKSIIQSL